MNNKLSRLSLSLSLSLLSKPKGGAHWSDLSLLHQTSERGSEALLSRSLDGLSDLSGGDS